MRWTKVVALTAVGAVSLAACGGSPSSNNSKTSSSSSGATGAKASAAMDPNAKGPAPEVSGAKKGGTLTISYASVPETFDPTSSYYLDTMAILGQLVIRSLTTYQTKADGTSVLVPDLATDLGKQSADGLTWTFTLKDGVKYADGTPIKAADVAYAVKRSFAQTEFAGGPTYVNTYLKGGDKYKGPFSEKSDFQGVTAPDDKTVVFHLVKKWPTLPYYASFSQVSPIPQAKDTKDQYGNNPLASGPYMFKSYTKGQSLTLVKNPNWDAASDPARHQFVDQFDFKFGTDTIPTQTAILASNGSAATTLNWDGVDASLVSQVQGAKKGQLVTGPGPCVSYSSLDTRKIPLAVRKAYAVAYPYDQIRKAGGETTLSYKPATSYIAPQVPGFAAYAPVNGLTGTGTGDPAKAKSMLAAAGQSNFEISYYYANDNPIAVQVNAAKKSALQAAGFKVRDVGVSKTTLRKHRNETDGKVNSGTGVGSWCYDWPSGDSVYPPLFASANQLSGVTLGFLGPGSNADYKTVDSMIDAAAALPADQAPAKWNELDKYLETNVVPGVPADLSLENYLFGTKVHNVVNDPNHGMPDMSQIWVG